MSEAALLDRTDRALGALFGGAMGDALGMPTQSLTPEEITRAYGRVEDFVEPASDHPLSHGLVAGSVTDDTEQTLLLARHIVASPDLFDESGWARLLADWEVDVRARNLQDLLGPSTKRALEALAKGEPPDSVGRFGDTNGAAMRIAPVGIATPVEPLSGLVDQVEITCRITHNTAAAISAASAVAAAISTGLDGGNTDDAVALALAAAAAGANRGHDRASANVADRMAHALNLASNRSDDDFRRTIADQVGTSVISHESIPASFAVFKFADGDAWKAGVLSANLGGDTDTIGAIAAGMTGACSGVSSMPGDKVTKLKSVNDLALDALVARLLDIRQMRDRRAVLAEQTG